MSRTLNQWESYLVSVMPRVQLLSELGLNFDDMHEIAGLFKQENKKYSHFQPATRNLVKKYPSTLVAFLAAFAAQNTEREFWDALARLLEVSGSELNNSNWRRHFIEILKERGKPSFEDVGGITNKYVTSMRIHGGIPSYSLRDFFAHMLMPALEKPEYIELKGVELRDALLKRSDVQLFTDSTVRNFFENSGDIGLQFLESSRHLAHEYISQQQIPPDINLPTYVAQKLVAFLESHEDEKHGLRRPRIIFDPDGEGLLLELPEQPISGSEVRGYEVRWQIHQGQKLLQEERSRIIRNGRDVVTEAKHLILGYLLDPFQVTFCIQTENDEFKQIREWTFDIRSPDMPNLLVFRKEDGSLLRWSQTLPAQELLLVYPKDISIYFEGDVQQIYSPNMYAEGWNNWKAEYISLENAWSLTLYKGDEKIDPTIPIQKQLELPRLFGEPFIPNLDPRPLYVGAIPKLRIPLRPGVNKDDELKRWQVEIKSIWEAIPSLRQGFRLSDKAESITINDWAIDFDLSAVMGNEPKGTYSLRVRGPLETDVELSFRVWPSLYIKDLPGLILPSDNQKVVFHITLPAHALLELQAGIIGNNVTGQYGRYEIEIDETVSRLDFNLVWPQENSSIHVPFSLPIPRLEWRLGLGEETTLEWYKHPLHKPIDAFMQASQISTLLVHLYGIEKITDQISLNLIDPEDPAKISQQFAPEKSALGNDYIRFMLNARDTLDHFPDVSIFEFQLVAPFGEGNPEAATLLSLTRNIDISKVCIENTEETQYLLWEEPSPLRNRRVFIHSMWKGWADSWNIRIPDDVRGKFDLLNAGYGLPPSWYEVHFYVASSWEKDKTSAPDCSTLIVKTITPEDQISWLDRQIEKHPEKTFLNHFERACLYSTLSNIQMRDHEITNCYNTLDQAKPTDLFSFHEWLEKYDTSTKRAVRMKMYSPEHLQHLFLSYKPRNAFRQKYLRFVAETNLKPESALLLIENENEPSIVFHALRELIKHRDTHVLSTIAQMVENGRLSDSDTIGLLKLDEEYFLSELESGQPSPVNLRLLSSLLHEKDELLSTLSNEKILNLANAEKAPEAIKKYLGILIEREDQIGLKIVFNLFQKGLLLSDEVTELLGKNLKFSIKLLSSAPSSDARSVNLPLFIPIRSRQTQAF